MRVLIVVGSKHGSTRTIADSIARVIRESGLTVDVRAPEDSPSIPTYDAAVIGSAVYMGRWLSGVTDFVAEHESELLRMPVWLFSSGPLGAPPVPDGEPSGVAQLADRLQARGRAVLPGRLDRGALRFGERALVRMVRAPYGDYRNWPHIASFAQGIAEGVVRVSARL